MTTYSFVTYEGDGSTTDFSLTFPYSATGDISVFVDGVDTDDVSSLYEHSFVDATTVRVTALSGGSAPGSGEIVKLARNTPISEAVASFSAGSSIRGATLNDVVTQLLYALQEASDDSANTIQLGDDDKFDSRSKVIKNVADPVSDNDAVNKGYFEGTFEPTLDAKVTAAETAQSAAETAQSGAEVAETAAVAAQGSAETAQSAAETAQSAAETAETNATAAEVAAEAALDELTDLYLGAKASDPTLDNDGNALQDGALYFNTTNQVFRGYNLGDTTWYDADDASASAAAAAASETAAETAETGAEAAQTAAETAQSAAETAQSGAESAETGAVAAQSAAETAQSAAETAETGAEAAQTAAESAQSAAETAQAGAETAETNAETAQTAAEAAQTAAETAETNAAASETAAASSASSAASAVSDAVIAAARGAFRARHGVMPSDIFGFNLGDVSRLTLTRATTGFRTTSGGGIESKAIDAARITHDPETGEPLGLLLEPQQTNHMIYSDLQAGGTGVTNTADNAVGPDGATTARTIFQTATSGIHFVGNTANTTGIVSGTKYLMALMVKKAGSADAAFAHYAYAGPFNGPGSDYFGFKWDTATETVVPYKSTSTTVTVGQRALANDWFLLWAVTDAIASGTSGFVTQFHDGSVTGPTSFAGDANAGIAVKGCICVPVNSDDALPPSLIETDGSQATRSPDVAGVDLTGVDAFRRFGFSVVTEFDLFDSDGIILELGQGASNEITLEVDAGDLKVTSGSGLSLTALAGVTPGERYVVAIRAFDGDHSVSVNGNTCVTSSSDTLAGNTSDISFGADLSGNGGCPVSIHSVAFFGHLTDTQLENISNA